MTSHEFIQIEQPKRHESPCDKKDWFVFASPPMQEFAEAFCEKYGVGGRVRKIQRNVFSNQCPNMKILDVPELMTQVGGATVLYFHAYRDLRAKKMEEMLLFVLTETFNVERLVVVDPFDPWATMERVSSEGEVASANIDAHFWKTLPLCQSGRKVLRLIYDQHTLQNRFFYQGGNTRVAYRSGVPLFKRELTRVGFVPDAQHAIAFPDEGACKRFGKGFPRFELITCGKKRGEGDQRVVTILDGAVNGRQVCIVDDLVRSGGTLIECARALLQHGAAAVSLFVVHAEFPQESWRRFLPDACPVPVSRFWICDTVPDVAAQIAHLEPFQIISIADDVKNFIDVLDAQ